MFKVEITVDDKKLPKALMALNGMGYDLQVHPITNVKVSKGQLKEAGAGRAIDLTKAFLKQHLLISGAAVTTKELTAGTGAPYSSTMFAIKELVADKTLQRVDRGQYTINPNKL